jgi:hypothetical protein
MPAPARRLQNAPAQSQTPNGRDFGGPVATAERARFDTEAAERPSGTMSLDRLRNIVHVAVPMLFAQIQGGRIVCESEATLQLHLGRIVASVADLLIVSPRETFSIELEKPLRTGRGRIDIWFRLMVDDGTSWRCAMELKFYKKASQKEPNNRYDVFKDIHRLERSDDVADLGFMLVATDHPHYIEKSAYAPDTSDFDFRDEMTYSAGTIMTYRTAKPHGPPIALLNNYHFKWTADIAKFRYLLLEVVPQPNSATSSFKRTA